MRRALLSLLLAGCSGSAPASHADRAADLDGSFPYARLLGTPTIPPDLSVAVDALGAQLAVVATKVDATHGYQCSTAPTSGSIVAGSLVGYDAADALCDQACAGSHQCRAFGWYRTGTIFDCGGFQSAISGRWGTVWTPSRAPAQWNCADSVVPALCCR